MKTEVLYTPVGLVVSFLNCEQMINTDQMIGFRFSGQHVQAIREGIAKKKNIVKHPFPQHL